MFQQRHFLEKLTFEFEPEGLLITESSFLSSRSYRVLFEHVPAHPTTLALASKGWLAATVASLVFAAFTGISQVNQGDVEKGATIFWSAAALLCGLRFWASRRRYLVFRGELQALVLMQNRPSQEEFARFVHEIHARKHAYLSNYLMSSEPDAVQVALERLAWLRHRGIILDSEFEEMKAARAALSRPMDGLDRIEH